MVWVIDASIAVRWFLSDEAHTNADAVLQKLIDRPEYFAVPELFAFEVYAVLCRIHPTGQDAYIKGMIPILNGGIFRQPMTEKLVNGAGFFVRKGLTGYDACYAALARELKGEWLTFDEKAHNCLQGENLSFYLAESMPDGWESQPVPVPK